MIRVAFTSVLGIAFVTAFVQAQAGGAGASGQAGQPGQGQAGQAGQAGQPGQAGQGGQIGQQSWRRGYYQQPWFGQNGVRQQLKLTDDQYNRLNQTYGPLYQRWDQSWNGMNNIPEAERQARMNESYSTFYRDQDNAYKNILTPEQQSRYNQLSLQYRGYDALLDPTTRQKLNLTDAQVNQLRQYDTEYGKQMDTFLNQYRTNPSEANNAYNKIQPQVNDRINQVLNDQQRRQWTEMTGPPYRFEPFYGYQNSKKQ